MRITGPGDYRYEGADLGILITRGRSMDDNFKLNIRARDWIRGIQKHYAGKPHRHHRSMRRRRSRVRSRFFEAPKHAMARSRSSFHTLIEDKPGPAVAGPVRAAVAGLPVLVSAQRRCRPAELPGKPARAARAHARAGADLGAPGRAGRRRRRRVALPVDVVPAGLHRRLFAGGLDRPARRRRAGAAAQLRLRAAAARRQLAGHALDRPARGGAGRLPVGRARRHQRSRPGGLAVVRRAHRLGHRLRHSAGAALRARGGAEHGRGDRAAAARAGQHVLQRHAARPARRLGDRVRRPRPTDRGHAPQAS